MKVGHGGYGVLLGILGGGRWVDVCKSLPTRHLNSLQKGVVELKSGDVLLNDEFSGG